MATDNRPNMRTLSNIIALLVIIGAFIFALTGRMDPEPAALIVALGLSELLD